MFLSVRDEDDKKKCPNLDGTMRQGDDERGEEKANLQESSFDMTSDRAEKYFFLFGDFALQNWDPVANDFISIHSGRSMSLS